MRSLTTVKYICMTWVGQPRLLINMTKINCTQINSTTARRHDGTTDEYEGAEHRTGLVGQYETTLVVCGRGIRTWGWARSGYMHAPNRIQDLVTNIAKF